MRAEFLGPPTSGKSTLYRILRDRGITSGKNIECKAVPAEWKPFGQFIERIYGERFPSLKAKSLRALRLASAARGKDWVVFDELIFQFGLSLGIRIPEYEERYFREAPAPDLLIVLSTKEKGLKKRNGQRLDRDRFKKTLRAVECIERVMPIIRERGIRVVEFDTSVQGKKEIVNEVMKCLK